jgi:hypothetical protein
MTDYDNTNKGVLFKNDRKEKETQPDYKGSVNISGQDFWLSAWIKEGKNGKFMSLSVQDKTDTGYQSFKKQGETLKKDTVVDVTDEPIDLSSIPF